MAYKIATLIHFYKITMERTIGEEAQMVGVLNEYVPRQCDASNLDVGLWSMRTKLSTRRSNRKVAVCCDSSK